jgi:polysaccharide export outer membrane protein
MKSAVILALATAALAGCSNGPRLGETSEPMVVTKLADLPPPDGVDSSAALPYRIAGLDKLNLMVVNVPELTGIYRLDSTGSFSLPYIGMVKAAGRTPDEVASDIQVRLRDGYVNDPRVAVNIDQADSLNFSIDGQVNNPGEFAATPRLTLMRAVALAKGVNEYARLNDVVVFRTVKGERYAALYDLGAIRRGVYADPRIYPDDLVVVGDTAARRKLMQFVQALPLLTTPVVLALQRIR